MSSLLSLQSSRVLALLLLLMPMGVMAAVGDKTPPELFDVAYLLRFFGSLLLVFGALYAMVFFLRRVNGVQMTDRKSIRVLGSAKVGTREKIVLVEAGDQQLLIGVAAGGVSTLLVFNEHIVAGQVTADDGAAKSSPDSPLEGKPDFASLLRSSTKGEERP